MPIMTATRSTVSRASAGWRAHHVSVLVMLAVRTVRFAFEPFCEGSDRQSCWHVIGKPRVGGGGYCE